MTFHCVTVKLLNIFCNISFRTTRFDENTVVARCLLYCGSKESSSVF